MDGQAKRLVQRAVLDWKAGDVGAPILHRHCPTCHTAMTQKVPEKVETAVLDQTLDDGQVVDIALIAGGKPAAIILIAVDYDFFLDDDPDVPVPFIRLYAESVIEKPRHWHVIQDSFKPFTCQACRRYLSAMQAEVQRIARQLQMALPVSYYRYAPYACWRCGGAFFGLVCGPDTAAAFQQDLMIIAAHLADVTAA